MSRWRLHRPVCDSLPRSRSRPQPGVRTSIPSPAGHSSLIVSNDFLDAGEARRLKRVVQITSGRERFKETHKAFSARVSRVFDAKEVGNGAGTMKPAIFGCLLQLSAELYRPAP